MKKTIRILAVETSCDETAAAVVSRQSNAPLATIERSIVASQADLHAKYGGVYPEVASREHSRQILPVIAGALDLPQAVKGRLPQLSLEGIDYIAVTQGPGLIGSLLVGTQTCATLALSAGVPLLPINHLAGHIYASFIAHSDESKAPKFPLMSLIVSGGHTLLLYMKGHYDFQLLGQTRDDAAGEAFDKIAKLLGLGYPGGPLISTLAERGDRFAYRFPVGLAHETTYDFSFSGLKTAVLRQVQEEKNLTAELKANIAASFERAVVEAILLRVGQALKTYPVRDFILGGGVAANTYLRQRLDVFLAHQTVPVKLHVPPLELCTDNAAVIGAAALFSGLHPMDPKDLEARARFPLLSKASITK